MCLEQKKQEHKSKSKCVLTTTTSPATIIPTPTPITTLHDDVTTSPAWCGGLSLTSNVGPLGISTAPPPPLDLSPSLAHQRRRGPHHLDRRPSVLDGRELSLQLFHLDGRGIPFTPHHFSTCFLFVFCFWVLICEIVLCVVCFVFFFFLVICHLGLCN